MTAETIHCISRDLKPRKECFYPFSMHRKQPKIQIYKGTKLLRLRMKAQNMLLIYKQHVFLNCLSWCSWRLSALLMILICGKWDKDFWAWSLTFLSWAADCFISYRDTTGISALPCLPLLRPLGWCSCSVRCCTTTGCLGCREKLW